MRDITTPTKPAYITKCILSLVCAFFVLASAGCATEEHPYNPNDPLESMNRITFQFNRKVDKYFLKPAAQGYQLITPWPVREGVTNFFSNMGEVPTMANDLLQGQITMSYVSFWRFLVNTTVGIGGLIDVASKMGLPKHYNDLGITFAKWGMTSSAYLVIPFIGPSSIRDALAIYPNYYFFTLWPHIDNIRVRNSLFALDVINLRASLLDSEDVMKQAALDPYVFIRNAYMQKRASLIAGKTMAFSEDDEDFAVDGAGVKVDDDDPLDDDTDALSDVDELQTDVDSSTQSTATQSAATTSGHTE